MVEFPRRCPSDGSIHQIEHINAPLPQGPGRLHPESSYPYPPLPPLRTQPPSSTPLPPRAPLFSQTLPSLADMRMHLDMRHPRRSPPVRYMNLAGFTCQPGDPEYVEATRATGVKNNAPTYWFMEREHVTEEPEPEPRETEFHFIDNYFSDMRPGPSAPLPIATCSPVVTRELMGAERAFHEVERQKVLDAIYRGADAARRADQDRYAEVLEETAPGEDPIPLHPNFLPSDPAPRKPSWAERHPFATPAPEGHTWTENPIPIVPFVRSDSQPRVPLWKRDADPQDPRTPGPASLPTPRASNIGARIAPSRIPASPHTRPPRLTLFSASTPAPRVQIARLPITTPPSSAPRLRMRGSDDAGGSSVPLPPPFAMSESDVPSLSSASSGSGNKGKDAAAPSDKGKGRASGP